MSKEKSDPNANFPRYLIKVAGKRSFMTLRGAGVAYDNGQVPVEIEDDVLLEDLTLRTITVAERTRISEIADAYSASK